MLHNTPARTALHAVLAAALVTLGLSGCADPIAIGEPCTTAGQTSGCADGALCSNAASGATCRKVCTTQEQCAATESCNGVTGSSTKTCQPK